MTGLRIGVVGGSIAGCAMAIAAGRAGAEVTVHERSDGALQERGFGIVMPPPLHRELVAGGYLGADMPTVPVADRVWLTRTPGGRSSRELARQRSPVAACNWGLLWRALRGRVGKDVYRRGTPVESVGRASSGRALIRTGDGEREYDIVVGADGHRSVTRALVAPDVRPVPAGYLAWRGTIPLDVLRDHPGPLELLRTSWVTLGFSGGHAVFYLIPGPVPGSRLLAHVVYGSAPRPAGAREPVPVEYVRDLAEEHFPAEWADIVARGEYGTRALHPVADFVTPRVAEPPFLLAGDAASVTRPHTASGAVKALQDALCLERALRAGGPVAEALRRYADERTAEGARLVELGRRLGRALVERTPDWPTMGPAEVEAWSRASLNGDRSYLYGSVHRP
ncbi:FAD-dependent monooxygenase [Streptomyces sp. ML-6]|uniref:FAD-dependent monooxygenase n=1 Tax=Streptomyces sp. ML-6 TaxID=2982693 RepID=UPI0024C05862|nr:FAD-dependent monooxygenase [Streptomyces sp. ML-6]MDK0522975.1 FAD-dependent monooxygenase [Streptomyces sp. ML-6]